MSNEFDAAVTATLHQDAATSARMGVLAAVDTNPDAHAEDLRIARRTGLPVPTVANMPAEARRQDAIGSIDFDTLVQTSPSTAALLADPEKAKLAHDDTENMSALEQSLTFLKNSGKALAAGVPGFNASMWGLAQAGTETFIQPVTGFLAGTILPEDIGARMAADFAQKRKFQDSLAKGLVPKADGVMSSGYYSGLQSLSQNLLTLPLALGGPELALGVMSAQPGGQAYGEARDKGVSVPGALAFGGSQAAIEYATEKLPMHLLLKDLKVGTPFYKMLATQIAAEVPGEQVATVLQDANDWAVLNPEKPFSSYLAERPSAAAQTLIATVVGAGGQVSVLKGLQTVTDRLAGREREAQQAEKVTLGIEQLNKLAEASKLRERDPETFAQFVAQATENGPVQHVFIDAQTLAQSGVADQVAALSPSVGEQLQVAIETGGQVRIPVAEYASTIAGTEYAQSLLDHLKTEPTGFSRAEAQEYMQSQAEEMKAQVERVLTQKQEDDSFKVSRDVVREAVKLQLDEANRFKPDVNETYSAMVSNFYAVTAAKMGISPEALFERYPLGINAQSVAGGQTLSQGPTLDELKAAWKDSGLKTTASESADRITLSQIIVPESERGTGKGTAAMQALVDYADTVGKHIVLSPSADFGGNKKRLIAFYKRFGFVENKGKNRAFTTTESMYRTAPGKVLHQSGRTIQVDGVRRPIENSEGNLLSAGFFEQQAFWKWYGAGAVDAQGRPVVSDGVYTNGAGEQKEAGVLAQGNRGSFNPATLSITLLKNADLSTFLHEAGHFFLELTADIAERPDAPAEIKKDMDALLKWFGVRDIQEWHSLDFEEKRGYHEQFARGFEAYLFEGNAPSIEMQGMFQRFRAWMLNIYRDLKNLNVELTPEVRGVFDRMLASSEQIAVAEQARSLMPLFTSPDQAGMTVEEFAAYQTLGNEATQGAISELEGRGLRDMQWIHNAKGRVIKKLQKEAKARRAEVEMEVRREVMSQPVYRAWQFLTNKITAEDKINPPAGPRKSDPDHVDPTVDSLFAAIAKMGGVRRSEVESQWGIDKKEQSPQPVFGKPVMRRDGGKSLDAMAESLAELGYLERDEYGRHDVNELSEKFEDELRGSPHYSYQYDYSAQQAPDARDNVANPEALGAGRLDRGALVAEFGNDDIAVWKHLDSLKMIRNDGLHPDVVAELFGFTSGDELVRTLAAAEAPKAEIDAITDQRMLERFGDLSSPEAIDRAANKAIHNDARARFVATEHNALAKATGRPRVLTAAAKQFAADMISRLKIRDIKPSQYAAAEVRAAKAAEKASKAGDLANAATEKRNELINLYATKAAYDGQEEVRKALAYFKRFDTISKTLDVDYREQIEALLERFDLRASTTLKEVDKRKSLAAWIESQHEQGLEPDVPDALLNESMRKSVKDMTLEELRGLRDTVVQIEHLGRLKNRLLTAKAQAEYEAVRDEIVASIELHAGDRTADTRTATTNLGRTISGLKRFWAAHIKVASWSRIMDGGKDGGPMWEYFIRSANEAGDNETVARAKATEELSKIMEPVLRLGKMGGKGQFFPSIQRSLNRESRIAIALNVGNEGNLQRLLGGEGWTLAQLQPVLQTLTREEWTAVQAVWDHFESYRPQIAAKERRIYGKEPAWVEPKAFTVAVGGEQIELRGGYYPIKYDPAASERAEAHADAEAAKRQLQGAYTSATTKRSFTKARADEVSGRPLLYTLAGMYSGVNDVIHDLAWHEWLIDANKLLRSKSIDGAIRNHYGPEVKQQFKAWMQDVAEGEKGATNAGEMALAKLRQNVSVAGLGFNLMSAMMQPLGLTQSIVRVGGKWIGRGVAKYAAHPIDASREANEKSTFMEMRARTRFRELNELRNRVQDQHAVSAMVQDGAYFLMMRCQQMVDVPTWHGAYEKAIAEGNDEERAVALADQAVIDAQGGGQTKDLSAIERGGPAQKLFTVFYSFMNTALNLGVAQTMTASGRAKLMCDYLLLFVAPVVLGSLLKSAITPGDDGDDDLGKLALKLIGEEISYLMGMMFVVREFSEAGKTVAGVSEFQRGYSGPAGVRIIGDATTLAKQVQQGELDDAFRKAMVNAVGDLFGLPAAQINRTVTGVKALAEGKTQNPLAIGFGFEERR